MLRKLTKIIRQLPGWLLPTSCALCGKIGTMLCDQCQKIVPWHKHACQRCGNSLTDIENINSDCGKRLSNPPPFTRMIVLFQYDKPITKLITGLKFQHKLVYARLLGNLLSQQIQQHHHNQTMPECLIPVPLHTKRIHERGFNQALEIARPIAKTLNIPIDYQYCNRTRATAAQTSLPAKQRGKNVKNAFAIQSNKSYRHVALIDDVVTTGHTITELSHTLRNHGVETIEIWCCAHAFLKV